MTALGLVPLNIKKVVMLLNVLGERVFSVMFRNVLKREKNKGDRVCEGGLMCYENAAFVKGNLQQVMN